MPSFDIENKFGKFVIGIDEAGRGPLVGPVFAACAWINRENFSKKLLDKIKDSKKIPEIKREILFEELTAFDNSVFSYGIGCASVTEIDELNILNAAFLAMERAYIEITKKLEAVNHILVDGNIIPKFIKKPANSIVKGDDKSYSIAAASILAKVSRDREIIKISKDFPDYNWHKNKGYATKDHINMIIKKGYTKHHRKTFKLKKLQEPELFGI